MLESSDKFYTDHRKPRVLDKEGEYCLQVLNCLKVLMEPAGISSSDAGAVKDYKSWPEYCKRNKFIS